MFRVSSDLVVVASRVAAITCEEYTAKWSNQKSGYHIVIILADGAPRITDTSKVYTKEEVETRTSELVCMWTTVTMDHHWRLLAPTEAKK